MGIKEIKICNEGYVFCKSSYYTVIDILSNRDFVFSQGINKLSGEIDSGIFGISYLVSMFDKIDTKSLFLPLEAKIDGTTIGLSELSNYSCYMDISHRLFSSNQTIHALIKRGLKKSQLPYTTNDILDMFAIQSKNHLRTVKQTGNEKFKIMAAIGFSYGKEIFCFPWLSKMRYESFNKNLDFTLEKLNSLSKVVILPIGDN